MGSFNSTFWNMGAPWMMSPPGIPAVTPTMMPILAGIGEPMGLLPGGGAGMNPLMMDALLQSSFVPQFQQLGMLSDPYYMGNALAYSQPMPGSVVNETLGFLQELFSQRPPATPIVSGNRAVPQPLPRQSSSGGSRQDAVAWARAQLGVSERNNPEQVREYSQGRWEAWCADFVSTALEQTGGSPWGHISTVSGILDWASRNGRLTQTPKVGDVFLQKNAGKSHTGIVEEVKPDGTVIAIAGNTRDEVRRMTFKPGDPSLTGFVDMA